MSEQITTGKTKKKFWLTRLLTTVLLLSLGVFSPILPVQVANAQAVSPTVSTISPAYGRMSGGTSVTISGTGFEDKGKYYKTITIGNGTGVAVSNYQYKLTINTAALVTAGKMLNSCNDLIFYDNDKTTVLNYWVESGCNTTSTIIWVKIPSLPAATTYYNYMFYGSGIGWGTTYGQPTNVFDFFDHFTTDLIGNSFGDKWMINTGTGLTGLPSGTGASCAYCIYTAGSQAILNSIASGAFVASASGTPIQWTKTADVGYVAEMNAYTYSAVAGNVGGYTHGIIYHRPGLGNYNYNLNSYHAFAANNLTAGSKIRYGNTTTTTDFGSSLAYSIVYNTTYRSMLYLQPGSSTPRVSSEIQNYTGTSSLSYYNCAKTIGSCVLDHNSMAFGMDNYIAGTSGYPMRVDWFRVRKHPRVIPSIAISGSEYVPTRVTIAGITATNVSGNSTTTITATTGAPGYQTSGSVIVYDDFRGTSGSGSSFVYYGAPTFSSISPNEGTTAGGTSVTINGTNFYDIAFIWMDLNASCYNITVISPTQLTCNTPGMGAGLHYVDITNGYSSVNAPDVYTSRDAPTIASGSNSPRPIVPFYKKTSDLSVSGIVITGTSFYETDSLNTVTFSGAFSGTCSSPVSGGPTTLSCDMPVSATEGLLHISVTTPSGVATLQNSFYYTPYTPPTVNNSYQYLMGIAKVGLTGETIPVLKIDNTTSVPNALSHDTAPYPLPWYSAFYTYYGTVQSAAAPQNNLGIPTIKPYNSYLLTLQAGGSYRMKMAAWIDYNRDNDFADSGEMAVSWTDSLSVGGTVTPSFVVPAVTGTGQTRMRIGAEYYAYSPGDNAGLGPTNYGEFEDYLVNLAQADAPTVSAITPNKGSTAGTNVTISGTGFQSGASVFFGALDSNPATSVNVLNTNTITATTPNTLASGTTYAIYVRNTDGQSGALGSAFTAYGAPTITAINPYSGGPAGGTGITITGTNFYDNTISLAIATLDNGTTSCSRTSMPSTTTFNCNVGSSTVSNAYTGKTPVNVRMTTDSGTTTSTYPAFDYSYYTLPNLHTTNTENIGIRNVTLSGESGTSLFYNSNSPPSIYPSGTPPSLPNNNAYNSFYTNFGSIQAGSSIPDLKRYGTYTLYTSGGTGSDAPTYYIQKLSAWLDYNRDYDFQDTTPAEQLINGLSIYSSQLSNSITIPYNASLGQTRMRICVANSTCATTGNGAGENGEVEDYVVNIIAASPPNITSITPSIGPANNSSGTYSLSIYDSTPGGTFHPGATVSFIGPSSFVVTEPALVVADSQHITLNAPNNMPAGTYNVTVTNSDGQSYVLVGGYRALDVPYLNSLGTTYFGVPEGGNQIFIYGGNFYGTPTAYIDGVACSNTTLIDEYVVRCTVPAGTGVDSWGEKHVPVYVNTASGNSSALSNGYYYTRYTEPVNTYGPYGVTGLTRVQLTAESGSIDYTTARPPSLSQTGTPPSLPYPTAFFTNYNSIQPGTVPVPTLYRNKNYSMSLTTEGGNAGYFKVWIDGNKDNDFADANEEVDVNMAPCNRQYPSGTSTCTFNLNLPLAFSTGQTRMRVAVSMNAPVGDGTSVMDGEVEDYTVNVSAQPTPTVTTVSPAEGAYNSPTAITITGTNFQSGATVRLSRPGYSYDFAATVVNSTTITATVSGLSAGNNADPYDVSVIQTDGATGTKTDAFISWGAPTLATISPNYAPATAIGNYTSITGTNFWGTPSVTFNGVASTTVTVNSPTSISALIPSGTDGSNLPIRVTTATDYAQQNLFEYFGAPTFTSITPYFSRNGIITPVTIAGGNFYNYSSYGGITPTVQFSKFGQTTQNCTSVNVTSSSSITCQVPLTMTEFLGPWNVTVTTSSGTILSPNAYIRTGYTDPVLSGVTDGLGITRVQMPGETSPVLAINNTTLTPTSLSPSSTYPSLPYPTPYFTDFGPYQSSTPPQSNLGIPSLKRTKTYNLTVTPGASVGQKYSVWVDFNGDYDFTDAGELLVDNVAFPGVGSSNTTSVYIDGSISTGGWKTMRIGTAGTGDVIIPSDGSGVGQGSGEYEDYRINVSQAPTPLISSFSPRVGPPGSGRTITITGSYFFSPATVKMGTDYATAALATNVSVVSNTTITADTPALTEGTVSLWVTTGAGYVIGPYSYRTLGAPIISEISPNKGPLTGGQLISISGANLYDGNSNPGDAIEDMSITIGGNPCTNLGLSGNYNVVTCETPPGTAGTKDVVITTLSGPVTSTGGYTYFDQPTFTSIEPNAVKSNTSGIDVLINGSNFYTNDGVYIVSIGGSPCTFEAILTTSQIQCTVPALPAGAKDVVITTPSDMAEGLQAITYYDDPTVTSVNPIWQPLAGGGSLTISGTSFFPTGIRPDGTVTVGGEPCTNAIINANTTSLTCVAPPKSAGPYNIVVNTPIGSGTGTNLITYYAAPDITDVTQKHGPAAGGVYIDVLGSNFRFGAIVKVGGVSASTAFIDSGHLRALTPSGTSGTTVDIEVTNPAPDGQSDTLATIYSYFGQPTFAGVSPVVPHAGPSNTAGTTITVNGSNFYNIEGSTQMTLNVGASFCTPISINAAHDSFTCTLPSLTADPQDLVVTTASGFAELFNGYIYYDAPTIISILPTALPASPSVPGNLTINGTNIYDSETVSSAYVNIGGSSCGRVSLTEDTSYTCTPPQKTAGTYSIALWTRSGSVFYPITYYAAPTVTDISIHKGPAAGGDDITITGTNFYKDDVNPTTVTTNGTTAFCDSGSIDIISSTQIDCTTVGGTDGTIVNVVVTTPSGQSSPLLSTYEFFDPPTITEIAPNQGSTAGGQTITITGDNFYNGTVAATVNIGSAACTGVNVISPTSLTCVTPANTAGGHNVTVTTSSGESNTVLFQYWNAPNVSSVTPNAGPTGTSIEVGISGSNFYENIPSQPISVTVGGTPCLAASVQAWNHINCTIPTFAGDPGIKEVIVTTLSGSSPVTAGTYYTYYDAPTITSLSPFAGGPGGGSQIYFYGTNFYDNLTYPISVTINNIACQSKAVVTPSSLWCNIPVGTLLQVVDAAVTTGSGTTGPKTNAFMYDNYYAPSTTGTANNMGLTRVVLAGESYANLTLDNTSLTPNNLSHTSNPPSLPWPTPLYTNYVPVQSATPPQSSLGIPVLEKYGRYTIQASKIYGAAQHLGLWIDYNQNNSFADSGEFVFDDVHMGTGTSTYTNQFDIPATASTGNTRMRIAATALTENLRLGGYEAVAWGEYEDYVVNVQPSSAPTVTDFTPGVGPAAAGTAFTLTGTGIKPGARVYFDTYPFPPGPEATPSPVTWVNNTTVTGFTPTLGSGTNHTVFIVNPDNQSASLSNAYLAYDLPTVTDLGYTYFDFPAGGTTVNINGTNFYNGAIPVTAFIGSEECATTTYISPTQITCVVPPANPSAEGPVSVYVSTESGPGTPLANAFTFNNYGLPTITGPVNNMGLSLVQLRGETSYADYINNTSATPTGLSHTFSPPALPYPTAYYTNYTPSQSNGSATLGIPRLVRNHSYDMTLDGGTAGAVTVGVWIDFNQNNVFEDPGEFLFSDYIPQFGNLTDSISVPTSSQLGETRMRIYTSNIWAGPYSQSGYGEIEDYRVNILGQSTPTISSISPEYGPPNPLTSNITITGTNFESGAKVKIGTSYSTGVVTVNSTTITATTPALAVGDYDVQVEQADGTASNILSGAEGFHVVGAPTVTSITPDEVAEGMMYSATITGSNFYDNTQYPVSISIGGNSCNVGLTVVNPTTITCDEYFAPAAGVHDVSVTTGSGTGTGNDLLTSYGAPTVTQVTPDYGSTLGGETVLITGTNFFPVPGTATVTFDGIPASGVSIQNGTTIQATVPANSTVGLVDVAVTIDSVTGTLIDGYEYLPDPINPDSSTLTSYSSRIEQVNSGTYTYSNFNPVNEDFVKVTLYQSGNGAPAAGREVVLNANPSTDIGISIIDCNDPRHVLDNINAYTDAYGTACFRVRSSASPSFTATTTTLSATVIDGNYDQDATLSTTRELEIGPFAATSTLNYRYRNDDGTDLTASAIADTNVPFYNAVIDTAFRLRLGLTRNVPSGTDNMRFDEFSPTQSVNYGPGPLGDYVAASFKAFAGGYAINESNNKLYVITPHEEAAKAHVFKFDLNNLSQPTTFFAFPPVVDNSLPYGDRIDAPITSATHNITRTFIDPDNNLMYFVLTPYFSDAPSHSIRVYKVNLTTETVVDVFEEPSDLSDTNNSKSYDAEIDLTNGFLYLTISGDDAQTDKKARVMKIKLNGPAQAMTEVGQLGLGSASREITSSVIDLTNQYLYVTTEMPQKIVKIDLDVSPTLPPVIADEITLVPVPSESPDETVGYQSAVIDTVEGYAYFASSTDYLGEGYNGTQKAFITKVDTDPNRTFEVVSRLNIAPSSPLADDMTYANYIYFHNENVLENVFPAASIDTINGYAYFPASRYNQPRSLAFHKIIRIHLADFTRKSFNDEMIFSDNSASIIKGTIFRPSTGRGYLIRPSTPGYETLTEFNSTSRQNLKLQVAKAVDNQYCNYDSYNSYVWSDLPNADFSFSDSTHFSDGAATSNVTGLLFDNNDSFVAGQLKDSNATTSRISLGRNQFSEIEYSLKPASGAIGSYCFRLIDADPTGDNQVSRYPNLVYTLTGSDYDPTNYNIYPALSVGGLILSKTSVNLIEGTTTDNYGIKLSQAPASDVTVSVNADDTRLVLSPDATPGTPTETSLTFTTTNWDTYQYITVSAINNGTVEGTTTGLINHTVTSADAKFNNILSSPVESVLTDYGSSSANVLATVTGDASFTPPADFSFPEAFISRTTPNFSPTLNLVFSDTRGPSLDYVLTMQAGEFCRVAGGCIPLNRVFTATAGLVNIYNTFNPGQISQFISNYLQNGESLTDRSTYIHSNPAEDRPLSAPITLIDTRNVPSGDNNNPLQGDLSFELHLMIDFGSFVLENIGSYLTTLTLDFNTNP